MSTDKAENKAEARSSRKSTVDMPADMMAAADQFSKIPHQWGGQAKLQKLSNHILFFKIFCCSC